MLKTQTNNEKTATEDLQPQKAYDMMMENNGNPDFVLLDVCTKGEFDQRHLENAVNISFLSPSFKAQVNKLDKAKTYLVYCVMGVRSKMALKSMKKAGFKNVFNLVGGTLLWEDFEYPFAEGADTTTGLTLCPGTNDKFMRNRMKTFFKKMGLTKDDHTDPETLKKKMKKAGLDFSDMCQCGDMMPSAMSGCCGEVFETEEKESENKGG